MYIVKDYQANASFWDLNPQLKAIPPFSKLYRSDKSKNKKISSSKGWAVFLYAETSQRSLFNMYPEDEKRKLIEEEFNISIKDLKEEIDWYKENAIPNEAKLLEQYRQFLTRRIEFITTQEYNFETQEQLDRAASQSKRIWDDYLKVKKEYDDYEEKQGQGGRELSATEQGLI